MASNINYELASSRQILRSLGERLATIRLSRNITQKQLATTAGIGLRTLVRIEEGQNSSLETLIKVMHALGLAQQLESMIPDPAIRPIERVKYKGHERKRARPKVEEPATNASSNWKWGDET